MVLATSYIQQKKVSSRNADAQTNSQQKMLLRIMPAFFALISYSLPASLTLYFATSNTFRVAQQELISRTMYRHQRAENKAKKADRKANGAIDAKSTPKDTASPFAGGVGGFLRGLTGQEAEESSNGNGNGSSKGASESKGRPTPKRDGSTSGKSGGAKSTKPKTKAKKPTTSGRATPAGSLPQPRPRKKKRK